MFNTISCTPKQTAAALRACYAINQPAYLVGPPGIGKSEIVEQFAQEIGAIMPKPLVLSSLDAPDVRGVGIPDTDGRLKFIPPKFFPESSCTKRYVLFYDELGNAEPRLQAPVQQLLLRGECGDYTIPPNAYQVAAGNDIEDNCHVFELSYALIQRLLVIKVRPDAESWLEWALQNNIHPSVCTFIKVRPEYIHYTTLNAVQPVEDGVEHYLGPTPRSWRVVSDILKTTNDQQIREILISGKIGQRSCATFFAVLEELEGLPEPQTLLELVGKNNVAKAAKMIPSHLASLWGLSYSLYGYVSTMKDFENAILLMDYLYTNIRDGRPIGDIYTMFMELLLGKVLRLGYGSEFIKSQTYQKVYRSRAQELSGLADS